MEYLMVLCFLDKRQQRRLMEGTLENPTVLAESKFCGHLENEPILPKLVAGTWTSHLNFSEPQFLNLFKKNFFLMWFF